MNCQLRVITGKGVRRGEGIMDIRQTYRWCMRVSCTIPNNFRVRNKFIRSVYRYRAIIGLAVPEGNGSMFGMLEGVVDQRIAYLDSLYFSDQLSYTNYFNPTYGLKDIEFPNFIQFK